MINTPPETLATAQFHLEGENAITCHSSFFYPLGHHCLDCLSPSPVPLATGLQLCLHNGITHGGYNMAEAPTTPILSEVPEVRPKQQHFLQVPR